MVTFFACSTCKFFEATFNIAALVYQYLQQKISFFLYRRTQYWGWGEGMVVFRGMGGEVFYVIVLYSLKKLFWFWF